MKAIILAAGIGNRMKPLTDQTPKTMLQVGGKFVIEQILHSLWDNGVNDIIIVTGYEQDQLRNFLSSVYPDRPINYLYNSRYRETNNIYSLSLVFQDFAIDDDIILIESDLVYEPVVIERLIKSNKDNVALVGKFQSGMDGTVVTINDDNIITNVIPPHLQGKNFDFSDKYKTLNIYKFSRDFLNRAFKKLLVYYSKVFDDNCYYELILGILIYVQKEIVYAEKLNEERWAELDDPNDLSVAQFVFAQDEQFSILEKKLGGLWNHNVMDFCFLRNMYFPNDAIVAEMRSNLEDLIHNYGTTQEILNQKLAYVLLCKKENLNILNGASQVYPFLRDYLAGKRMLMPDPTFGEYFRLFPNRDTYRDGPGIDFTEIQSKAPLCDVVVFVNPNNPTGSVLSTEAIYSFAARNPQKFILVDESFIEFCDEPSIIPLMERNPLGNIIVLKSFSKVYGIPGLRLGMVYSCQQDFNRFIGNAIPIWNINSLCEFFLEVLLKHRDSLRISFSKTKLDREGMSTNLRQLNFLDKVFPSGGNFILVSIKKDITNANRIPHLLLSKYSLYVKDVSGKFLNQQMYLRLAVRRPEENRLLLECLQKVMESLHK